MHDHRPSTPHEPPALTGAIIALSVGNTRARVGLFKGVELVESAVFDTGDAPGIASAAVAMADKAEGDENPTVVMSSVHRAGADAIEAVLRDQGLRVERFGRELPIPVAHTLDENGAKSVGQDRLLCALGAFSVARQACVVVDLGTALTVDFVDGQGVFHGGAIAPGLSMMLRALHERTDALPEVAFQIPAPDQAFGRNTPDAMRLGVAAMACGAVRWLAERYAEHYEAYPRVIATGGDMGVLEGDGLVETFLPDLQLIGIRRACELLLDGDAGEGDDESDGL